MPEVTKVTAEVRYTISDLTEAEYRGIVALVGKTYGVQLDALYDAMVEGYDYDPKELDALAASLLTPGFGGV